jgi:glycosyltransferase involved in cell wall biosynthesis
VKRAFTFLFVGSPVHRKGLDRVLDAYLAEFTRDEDVCLIVKDTGARSFYRRVSRQRLREVSCDSRYPTIRIIDGELSDRELAGLYTASDCLVAPYRGEGFCLPVLEAMACARPAIIPSGGPTEDFATCRAAFVLPSETVPIRHMPEPPVWERKQWTMSGAPTELSVRIEDLRAAMRQAFADPARTRERGWAAHASVLNYTWANTARAMKTRLRALGRRSAPARTGPAMRARAARVESPPWQ